MLRVLGYWVFYAVVGTLLLIMAMAGGGDMGPEDSRSPIKFRTKLIGAASGAVLAVASLGWILVRGPTADPTLAWAIASIATPVAAILIGWSMLRIARELRARG